MDNDLATVYGMITTVIGLLFGIEMGVFFCAIGGSLLAVRFCTAKGTLERLAHFSFSVVFTCVIVGETSKLYPDWLSLKLVAVFWGALFLLIAELIYLIVKSSHAINFGTKLNLILDWFIDKWTR